MTPRSTAIFCRHGDRAEFQQLFQVLDRTHCHQPVLGNVVEGLGPYRRSQVAVCGHPFKRTQPIFARPCKNPCLTIQYRLIRRDVAVDPRKTKSCQFKKLEVALRSVERIVHERCDGEVKITRDPPEPTYEIGVVPHRRWDGNWPEPILIALISRLPSDDAEPNIQTRSTTERLEWMSEHLKIGSMGLCSEVQDPDSARLCSRSRSNRPRTGIGLCGQAAEPEPFIESVREQSDLGAGLFESFLEGFSRNRYQRGGFR